MKQIITTLAIMLCIFAMGTTAQAQSNKTITLQIKNAPAKLTKSQLRKTFRRNGISDRDMKKIKGFNKIINSLHKEKGQSVVQATVVAMKQIEKLSEGKIKIRNGKLGFADIAVGGTNV
jgi:hypothetical protein